MKSVCPMVCQKNENVLYTPCKPFSKPCPKSLCKPSANPLQTSKPSRQSQSSANPVPIPLRPLRGLHSLHLNKSKRGEYNRGLALQAYLLYTIKGFACRSQPIKHTIKGFPRNITKHTKRRRPRYSQILNKPLRKTFRFPLPP